MYIEDEIKEHFELNPTGFYQAKAYLESIGEMDNYTNSELPQSPLHLVTFANELKAKIKS